MPLLRSAFQAVQHNSGTVILYIGISSALFAGSLTIHFIFIGPLTESGDPDIAKIYSFASDIVIAILLASIQTLAFSRMGREIDRPMWRVSNDWDAFRLFFKLWLILNLLNVATARFAFSLAGAESDSSVAATYILMQLAFSVLLIPVGSAVMFYGRAGRSEIGLGISTMMHKFPSTLLIAFVGFCAGIVLVDLQPSLPVWAWPALRIVDAYMDCYLFAAMWIVCMLHRDESANPDDDFDF